MHVRNNGAQKHQAASVLYSSPSSNHTPYKQMHLPPPLIVISLPPHLLTLSNPPCLQGLAAAVVVVVSA